MGVGTPWIWACTCVVLDATLGHSLKRTYVSINTNVHLSSGSWLLSGPPGFTCWISFAQVFSFMYCWVPYHCFISFLCLDLYVLGDDAWIN